MARPKGAKDKKPRKNLEELKKPGTGYFARLADIPVNAEKNGQFIQFMCRIMPDRPLKLTDKGDVEVGYQRLKNYLEACDEFGIKIGNQQMYTALGVGKDDVWRWTNGLMGKSNPDMCDFLKMCRGICASAREKMMQDSEIPVVAGIFFGKNYDGLRDQQDVVVQTNNILESDVSQEQLAQKYTDSLKLVESVSE